MAFTLYASTNTETLQLNDNAPFNFESLEDASNPAVNRLSQRGPLQHGVSDLGYRLEARTLVLSLRFYASAAATLDTYRQTLTDFFAPLDDTSVFLYMVRDDDTTLRLTTVPVGDIEIDIIPGNYAAKLHRARVMLRAANPLWLDTTLQSASYSGTAGTASWWLAGGAISSSNLSAHGTTPSSGAVMTFPDAGGQPAGDYTIAFRSSRESEFGGVKYAYYLDDLQVGLFARGDQWFGVNGTAGYFLGYNQFIGTANIQGSVNLGTTAMTVGIANYFTRDSAGTFLKFNRGTALLHSSTDGDAMPTGGSVFWRRRNTGGGGLWLQDLDKYAVYNSVLSDDQIALLDHFMAGSAGFAAGSFNTVNAGDIPAYPVIRLTGPLSNITVTNSTTGASFSLGTTVIGSGDIYTIDLSDGNKQIYDANGVSKLSEVSSPVALANFFLAPNPIAAGGTNTITIAGTATATTSSIAVEHYNQYLSF